MRTNRTAEELLALQSDPLEPRAEEVERYIGALQMLAESDPDLAGRQTWTQIRLAGMRGSASRRGPRQSEPHLPARHLTGTGARRPL